MLDENIVSLDEKIAALRVLAEQGQPIKLFLLMTFLIRKCKLDIV